MAECWVWASPIVTLSYVMEDVVEMLNKLFERDIFASNWTKPRKLLEETINGNKVGWIIVSGAIRRYSDNLSKLPTPSVCEWCFTTFKASTVPCCLVSSSINLRGVLWVSGPAYYTTCRTIHHGKLILNRSLSPSQHWKANEADSSFSIVDGSPGVCQFLPGRFNLRVNRKKKSDIETTPRGSNESSNPLNNENSRFNERTLNMRHVSATTVSNKVSGQIRADNTYCPISACIVHSARETITLVQRWLIFYSLVGGKLS